MAAMFAAVGERGFGIFHTAGGREPKALYRPGNIALECLARLCIVASPYKVPPDFRKAAADVGGLPTSTIIPCYGGMPHCGCPGASVHAKFVEELCSMNPPPRLPSYCAEGWAVLPGMNPPNKRRVVCAALAAADCAYAAGQHREDPVRHPDWLRDWRDVEGGGCQPDDAVTKWMVRELLAIARAAT